MAILRAKDAREMRVEEIGDNLGDLKKREMRIKADIAAGIASEDIGKIREIKRTIARLLTIKKEKEEKR